MATNNPTKLTPELIELVFSEISTSYSSLKTACKKYNVYHNDLWKVINTNLDTQGKYARAKEEQIDFTIEEMNRLEDDCLKAMRGNKIDSRSKNALVQAYRLKIDNIKWLASKLKPKKYGDKLDLTHNIGDTISKITIERAKEEEDVQGKEKG
jgi:hypothetical protein